MLEKFKALTQCQHNILEVISNVFLIWLRVAMVTYIICLPQVKWHEMLKSTMQPDVVSVHRNLEMALNVEMIQRIVKW